MRRLNFWQGALAALVVAGVVVIVGVGGWMAHALAEAQERESRRQVAMDELVRNYADLYAQAQAEGVNPDAPEPADVAESLPTPAVGERGPVGPGPSPADVIIAVAAYCDSRGSCRGPAGADGPPGSDGRPGIDGLPGKDGQTGTPGASGANGKDGKEGVPGRPPTAEEIATAVAAYCEANNGCRGADGTNGTNGADVTDEQVSAAVRMYCASYGCPATPTPEEPPNS